MPEPTQITTHEADALKRLLEQYKDKDNLAGVLTAFNEQIQDLEDAIFGLFGKLDITNVGGSQLDRLGNIVGQDRLGLSDADYRLFIYAKIATNNSQGTAEEVMSIFKLITQSTSVQYFDLYPAAIQIMGDGSIPAGLEDFLKQTIDTACVAGVSVDLTGFFDDSDPFFFGETDEIGAGGFDDGSGTIGGKLGEEI